MACEHNRVAISFRPSSLSGILLVASRHELATLMEYRAYNNISTWLGWASRVHTFQISIRGNNTLYLVFSATAFWRSYTNLHADTSIWNTFCFPETATHISFFMVEVIKVRANQRVSYCPSDIDSLVHFDYVTRHSLKSCSVFVSTVVAAFKSTVRLFLGIERVREHVLL